MKTSEGDVLKNQGYIPDVSDFQSGSLLPDDTVISIIIDFFQNNESWITVQRSIFGKRWKVQFCSKKSGQHFIFWSHFNQGHCCLIVPYLRFWNVQKWLMLSFFLEALYGANSFCIVIYVKFYVPRAISEFTKSSGSGSDYGSFRSALCDSFLV